MSGTLEYGFIPSDIREGIPSLFTGLERFFASAKVLTCEQGKESCDVRTAFETDQNHTLT